MKSKENVKIVMMMYLEEIYFTPYMCEKLNKLESKRTVRLGMLYGTVCLLKNHRSSVN